MRTIPNVIFLSGKYFQVMKCFLRNCPVQIEIKMTKVYCKIKLKLKFSNFAQGTLITVTPHIRPGGVIILHSLQMRVLLENTTFLLHRIIRIAGIIRIQRIIRGKALYEDIRYGTVGSFLLLSVGKFGKFLTPPP